MLWSGSETWIPEQASNNRHGEMPNLTFSFLMREARDCVCCEGLIGNMPVCAM